MKVQKVDRRVTEELCTEQRKIVCVVEWETESKNALSGAFVFSGKLMLHFYAFNINRSSQNRVLFLIVESDSYPSVCENCKWD
jgi:hypothetical protein